MYALSSVTSCCSAALLVSSSARSRSRSRCVPCVISRRRVSSVSRCVSDRSCVSSSSRSGGSSDGPRASTSALSLLHGRVCIRIERKKSPPRSSRGSRLPSALKHRPPTHPAPTNNVFLPLGRFLCGAEDVSGHSPPMHSNTRETPPSQRKHSQQVWEIT